MRPRRLLAAAAVAAVVAVPACDDGEDRALPPLAARAVPAPTPIDPSAPLCDAIPGEVVAEATGRAVTVEGAGTQCSWRADVAGGDGPDVVLQGSFIDARSFEAGRRGVAAAVDGLGDDAYLVDGGDAAAPTLYVLDGSRAFALWLGDPAAVGPEGTLARLARQVLAS